jgi:5-methylcytosine-specific restriction endonuclease McrA
MVYVEVTALVPLCLGCKHSECRWLETQLPHPDIFSETWRKDYLNIGIPRKKVREASQSLKDGTWRGPECYLCGSVIELDVNGGEGFYLRTVSISEMYRLGRGGGRRTPKWMREIIRNAYEGKCSGCRINLTHEQITFDHIVPHSDGGETEIDNLQPMCKRCNQKKKNLPVDQIEHPPLHFPLLPFSENMLD